MFCRPETPHEYVRVLTASPDRHVSCGRKRFTARREGQRWAIKVSAGDGSYPSGDGTELWGDEAASPVTRVWYGEVDGVNV